ADQLEEKGWMVERQQAPDCIHLTILPTNVDVIDKYLDDLKAAHAYVIDHPGATARGNAAVYGLMARIPFRGMVEKSVSKIMEDLYGPHAVTSSPTHEATRPPVSGNALMGPANRLLTAWTRWRRHRHDR